MPKRRLKKWVKVLIIILLLIILIGGGLIIMNSKQENTKSTSKAKKVINTKEETSSIPQAPSNSSEYSSLKDGEYKTTKGYTLKIENGIAQIDGNIIVNKTYALPSTYVPTDPYQEITTDKCPNCINKDVMNAFKEMQADATSLGLNIYIASGYRSYSSQETLYKNYVAVDGIEGADTYSSRAGHSEHQSGLCFDLNTVEDSFANTNEGKWINNNAYLYGFTIRFPQNGEKYTGYKYESWHLRYVGKELAKKLYNNGNWVSIEEYYGITSTY